MKEKKLDLETVLNKHYSGSGIFNDEEFELIIKEIKRTSSKLKALQQVYKSYVGRELRC